RTSTAPHAQRARLDVRPDPRRYIRNKLIQINAPASDRLPLAGRARFIRTKEDVMAQKEPRTSASASIPNINPAQYAETGRKQVGAVDGRRKEWIAVIEGVSREWATRAQAEAKLATEVAGTLSSAKSIRYAAAIYEEWLARRREMFAEASGGVVADGQKCM